MPRIKTLFQQQSAPVLSIFFTAGYPKIKDTVPILNALQAAGVDLVEIGMPYSDPLADGPTIQESSQKALANGMTISTLIQQLKNCREEIFIPIILMGYLNPILQFGMSNLLKSCQEIGIDGLIIPDLPVDEYEETYKDLFEKYGIDNIILVTPETNPERLHRIDRVCSGFIYAVSSSSTTGSEKNWNQQEDYFKRLAKQRLKNPILTGFGVSDQATFVAASKHTKGAIIGTAFIKVLRKQKNGFNKEAIVDFIHQFKRSTHHKNPKID